MKRRSILWVLVIPYILLLAAALIGMGVAISSFVRSTYENNLRGQLINETRLVQQIIEPLLQSNTPTDQLQSLVSKLGTQENARVTIILPDGKVIADSQVDSTTMENHSNRPEVIAALSGKEATELRYSVTLKRDMLYAAVPIQKDGKVMAVARLSVSLYTIDENVNTILSTVTWITLGTALLAILLSIFVTRLAIQPLVKLTDTIEGNIHGANLSLPYIDRQDEIGYLSHAFNRMSEQLQEQIAELQTERSRVNDILANMTDGVLIADPKGNVQYINQAASHLFSISSQEANGRSVIEVVRHYRLAELWQKCQQTREQQSTTIENLPDRVFLQGIATPLNAYANGGTLMIFQDLTRLRHLETVRRDFVSNVSHELRTPLASLKALVETLQEGALEDPPAAHRFLGQMDNEIDNLTQMVQELLELSKIESGRVPLQKQHFSPVELVQNAAERMRLQAERAGLSIQTQFPTTTEIPVIYIDPNRMEQVLVNLIHNAIKFTPPGGHITLSAELEGSMVKFSISDTGVGISPDDLARIFERFYKADRARSGKGTGLGLSISRHLVESHNGRIWAESEVGKGSTFYFSLPIA